MARAIYETEDGRYFETLERAEAYERGLDLAKTIYQIVGTDVDMADCVTFASALQQEGYTICREVHGEVL